MNNISLTGLPTRQVLVYDVVICKANMKWRVKYKYDGETGSFLVTSLKKAREWCKARELEWIERE